MKLKKAYKEIFGAGGILDAMEIMEMVLKTVEINSSDAEWFGLGNYQNGREQGFTISCGNTYIKFSENRSSDDWIVYVDNRDAILRHGCESFYGAPSDEAYRTRKYFKPDQKKQVANYIVKLLQKSINEVAKPLNLKAKYMPKIKSKMKNGTIDRE